MNVVFVEVLSSEMQRVEGGATAQQWIDWILFVGLLIALVITA